jgi:excisionase family DNA binding protein
MLDPQTAHEETGAERLAFSIPTAAEVAESSRSEIYEALKRGALKAKKNGRRTIILRDDLMAYLASLPDYQAAA